MYKCLDDLPSPVARIRLSANILILQMPQRQISQRRNDQRELISNITPKLADGCTQRADVPRLVL